MKMAALDLAPELFLEFSQVCMDGGGLSRSLRVKENPLPNDVQIESVGMSDNARAIRLYLTSESFADVPENQKCPVLPSPIFETVYDGESEQ